MAKKAEKSAVKAQMFVQDCYSTYELTDLDGLKERCVTDFSNLQPAIAVEAIRIYIKPVDGKAYYVVNDEFTGSISLDA